MDATFSRMSGEFLATFCLTRNGEKVTRFHSLTLHCWSERLGVYADFGRCPYELATSPVTFIKALAAFDSMDEQLYIQNDIDQSCYLRSADSSTVEQAIAHFQI